MIKVLNITTTPLWTDGISNSLINYFENIDNKKIQLDFACPKVFSDLERKINKRNGNIHIIKTNRKNIISYIFELKKIIKDNKYDIIHIHGSSTILCIELLAGALAGCKNRIVHSRNTKSDHPKINGILRPLFNLLYTEAFACGKDAGIWLFGKNKKVTIIPNGKNFDLFQYDENKRRIVREENKIKNSDIVLGHIGNFNYQKNHDYLIEIFKELKEEKYKLILIGEGINEKSIKDKVKEYKLQKQVIFLGQKTVEEVANWLNAMDIMIFPSRFEGFPNVLIEWQMSGLNSIISDKITKDVKITDLVQFASIEDSPKKWAELIKKIKITNRKENKNKLFKQITTAGYNIKENGKMLEEKYIEIYEKNNK